MTHTIRKTDEIIQTLQTLQNAGFKNAIIAGGAIRDLRFDIIARDVDIFIQDPRFSTDPPGSIDPPGNAELIQYLDRHTGTTAIGDLLGVTSNGRLQRLGDDRVECASKDNYDNTNITTIYNVMKGYIPYQLIFVKINPVKFVEDEFDFGLCKCYCDGKKLRYLPDFVKDAKNKTLTLVAKNMNMDAMYYALDEHLVRLQSKFPGYKLQIAPWNEEKYSKYRP